MGLPPRTPFVVLACAATLFATFAATQQHAASDEAATSKGSVTELFKTQCLRCHQPPDLAFATDRAWLAQVHDTA